MNVVIIDNYDSFTYNLVQYLGSLGASIEVHRSDAITVDDVAACAPDAVVISPGPGAPDAAGISVPVARWCASSATPLLGVCLGHQAIVTAFGGRVVRAPRVMHGKTSSVSHSGRDIFRDLPQPLEAMRYHSLVGDRTSMPAELSVEAWTDDDLVMGVTHRTLPIYGVQFHPESILSPDGMHLLSNFLECALAPVVTNSSRR